MVWTGLPGPVPEIELLEHICEQVGWFSYRYCRTISSAGVTTDGQIVANCCQISVKCCNDERQWRTAGHPQGCGANNTDGG